MNFINTILISKDSVMKSLTYSENILTCDTHLLKVQNENTAEKTVNCKSGCAFQPYSNIQANMNTSGGQSIFFCFDTDLKVLLISAACLAKYFSELKQLKRVNNVCLCLISIEQDSLISNIFVILSIDMISTERKKILIMKEVHVILCLNCNLLIATDIMKSNKIEI